MAFSKEYLHFILEQLSDLDDISYRSMMGEYILYYRSKIVGGVYDDRLLVKKTRSALECMPAAASWSRWPSGYAKAAMDGCGKPQPKTKRPLCRRITLRHSGFFATYGDDSDYIPCTIKLTRNSWIFSDCFFFIAQIGKNSADSYAPNKDENAQKSYQISRCSIQNIAIGTRITKHMRYSVDFLYISQLKDWR